MASMRWPGGTLVSALVLVLGVAGCGPVAIPPEVLQRYVGRPAADLKKDWGEPSREVPDGDLRILVYEELRESSPGDFQNPRGTVYKPRSSGTGLEAPSDREKGLTVYVRSYLFWVNREGLVVRTTVREP
jgi:hypothetical protein